MYLQSGLSPEYQYDIFHRMDRFGVTEDALWERYEQKTSGFARAHFSDALDRIRREDELVVQTSLYAHLLDQTEWGMLKPDKAWRAGKQLLRQLGWEEKSSHRYRNQKYGCERYVDHVDDRMLYADGFKQDHTFFWKN